MDFGFIRGPDNLTDMASSGATQGKHVVEGRRGKECYLLIIDAASREIWTFPLKSKSPPTSFKSTAFSRKTEQPEARIRSQPTPMACWPALTDSNKLARAMDSLSMLIIRKSILDMLEAMHLCHSDSTKAESSSPKKSALPPINTDVSQN
jgi:hypothetical protein